MLRKIYKFLTSPIFKPSFRAARVQDYPISYLLFGAIAAALYFAGVL